MINDRTVVTVLFFCFYSLLWRASGGRKKLKNSKKFSYIIYFSLYINWDEKWEGGAIVAKLKPGFQQHLLGNEETGTVLSVSSRLRKKAAAMLLVFVMLFSFVGVPLADAFFTAEAASAKTTFQVTKTKTAAAAEAEMSFEMPLLLENEVNSLAAESLQTMQRAEAEEAPVWARLQLKGSFAAEDIFIPSLKLHFQGQTIKVQQGELLAANTLRIAFARSELLSWFAAPDETAEQILTITGEGYSGGLDYFTFSGSGRLQLEEVAVQPPETSEDSVVEEEAAEAEVSEEDSAAAPAAEEPLETDPTAASTAAETDEAEEEAEAAAETGDQAEQPPALLPEKDEEEETAAPAEAPLQE